MTVNITNPRKAIKEAVTTFDNFQDDISIMEFDHTSLYELRKFAPLSPTRYDVLILVGITGGNLDIQIDYISYNACKDSLTLIMPTHITSFINGSDDLKGWILTISKSYLGTQTFPGQKPTVISYMQLKKNPLTVFDHDEFQSLYTSLDFVRNKMRQHTHVFQQDVVKYALALFFTDLGNLYFGKRKYHSAPTLSRKEELFTDFQTLLREHCKKQHDVKFYADKLCITTQYLSSILKEQSGRSASQWIQEALIIEAKSVLKSPRVNVQQVADRLNFPDQSTFGKFFKKYTGLSPMSFRKS